MESTLEKLKQEFYAHAREVEMKNDNRCKQQGEIIDLLSCELSKEGKKKSDILLEIDAVSKDN